MTTSPTISGNIFIFHAFDVGEEIDLAAITKQRLVSSTHTVAAPYFKNYHLPLTVTLPVQHGVMCDSVKIHNFGVVTLRYRIPFTTTFEELRSTIISIDETYAEQSINDAGSLFHKIRSVIKQARFFHIKNSYVLIQVNEFPGSGDLQTITHKYGDVLASILRFEKETLSEHQKNEILAGAFSYYKKDLIIIDTDAAFICDDEYEEILDLFEFANMQHLELQYFDRTLDKQLNMAYEQEKKAPPFSAYLPFVGVIVSDPVGDLGNLKVDISVITDRLENSIKLAGEAYFSQLYHALSQKLDLGNWKESINRKLEIIHDIGSIYQHKLEVIREDLLTCSIIVLIMLELAVGVFNMGR